MASALVGAPCALAGGAEGARASLGDRAWRARSVATIVPRTRRAHLCRVSASGTPQAAAATTELPPLPTPVPVPGARGKTAVVVGAGVGGLAMAGRLARAGFAVTVLEKNDRVGGRLQSFNPPEAPAWRFDTGPSLLLFPDKYRECFAALGADIADYVDIKKVSPAYRAHFGDGTSFDLSYDMLELHDQLEAIEPGAAGKFFDWLGRARSALDLGVRAFIEQDCTSALDFVNPSRVLELALKVNPIELLGSQYSQMSAYFKSDKLRALFSYQELYVGLSPYNAPGVFSLLAATELTDGVWYPVGGFQKVRDALEALARRNGAVVRTGAAVERILVETRRVADSEGRERDAPRAVGVQLAGGERLLADVVVANPDIPYVFDALLADGGPALRAEAGRLERMDYSASVIEFNWAVDAKLAALLQHNVFLSSDFKGSWNRAVFPEDLAAPKQCNFYVHSPAYTDPSAAPPGCESVMVLLPVANLAEATAAAKRAGRPLPDPAAMVEAGREAILRRFAEQGVSADLRAHIKHEMVITPAEWRERYNLTHGAVFGLSHGLLQLACFRPPTQTGIPGWPDTPKVDGLYYVGASTRPGNGVPLVMMGVAVTYDNVIRDVQRAEGATV